jgi:flagellar biosynthesis protein FlhG
MLGAARVRTVALIGARSGAGTTTCAVNIAAALLHAGRSVLVIDEHFGPANAPGLLGLAARTDLKQVLTGDCRLRDALLRGPQGMLLLPAARGVRALGRLPALQRQRAAESLGGLDELCDVVLVDALVQAVPQGGSFAGAAQETLIVVDPSVTAITQAYLRIKHLRTKHGFGRFRVLINRAANAESAQRVFTNLEQAARGFLDVRLDYAGTVPADAAVTQAGRSFLPVSAVAPSSAAARGFQRLAREMLGWPAQVRGAGTLDHLFHRVIQTSRLLLAGAGA